MARLMLLEEMQHRLSVQVVPVFAFSETRSDIVGTAIIIAPGIALTAQHVMDEIRDCYGAKNEGNTSLDIYLFQFSTNSTWYVCNSSHWVGSDISVLILRPRNEEAKKILKTPCRFPPCLTRYKPRYGA